MDAVLTAGGIPLPEDPLYPYCEGRPKAMVDVAGKPMVQWVLDALSKSKRINNVILVGLTEKSGLSCKKSLHFVPNQGKILDNFRAGVEKALEVNNASKHLLLVSSDIPTITGEMVDWVIDTAMKTDEDVYYNIINRKVMEKRFPTSRRTFIHLKDMDVCGGDMNVVRAIMVTGEVGLWEKITSARKSPLKQAALIGYDSLFLLLFRRLTLTKAIEKVTKRLDITGRAIICPYAEVGMDVDKPHQLEIVREDLTPPTKRKKKVSSKRSTQTGKRTPKASSKTMAGNKQSKKVAK